jgi:hypothetical protein
VVESESAASSLLSHPDRLSEEVAMRIQFFTLILSGLLLWVSGIPLFGQSEVNPGTNDTERKISRIGLGTPLGAVGGTVSVPIVLVPRAGTSIRQLKLTVKYRSTYLAFERLSSPYPPNRDI